MLRKHMNSCAPAGVNYLLTGPDGSSMVGAGGLKKQ